MSNEILWSDDIIYQPFIGGAYHGRATRLLIVGESHYGFDDAYFDATREVMEAWKFPDQTRKQARKENRNPPNLRYLTIAARIINNQDAHQVNSDRANAFERCAWYNYVQAEILEGKTTDFSKNVEGSQRAFLEVVGKLEPTHILVTGKINLWNSLPAADDAGEATFADRAFKVRRYQAGKDPALAIPIAHASRASAPEWQRAVTEFQAANPSMSFRREA